MSTMKAVQYVQAGSKPRIVELPIPEPGPGQVLLRVLAAGMCHSDISVMGWPAEGFPYPVPLTLGHEGAGEVAGLGAGVRSLSEGDRVAVYGPWGCGTCHKCAGGKENYCTRASGLGIFPPGLGAAGAMAEYMIIDDPRHVVPLNGLDPVTAAPLTDAGLTPYHAIKRSLPKLVAGSTAVVIGAGGLGHLGVQLLRTLASTRVIALDVSDRALELARGVGAHEVLRSDEAAAARVMELTGGLGAELVVDFVGTDPTMRTAAGCVAVEGDITIVGIGGGTLPVAFGAQPFEVSVAAPYWGGRHELIEVLALARSGALTVHTETFPLEDGPEIYERLHRGEITGRAVLLP
ncbi:NAD(P)-dependent alcohol dehydrogenase [Saccharopolyspora gloriosae]|uniref:NAD(P)-dependent alcohol dehydrogenase n=1 Tax=Saccharopolyspora gloriosae TaxID=455344 RepID=UPI002867B644|nr:NAD(P)-dependent alcohol dehydrogenase [Saccharopolyspora gloriosae]